MPRLFHGATLTLEDLRASRERLAERMSDLQVPCLTPGPLETEGYSFLFPHLQDDPANLLKESSRTNEALAKLGQSMAVSEGPSAPTSEIPAAYTYFGQFVDHDVTFEANSATLLELVHPDMRPLQPDQIATVLRNARTSGLDLDSVYGGRAPMRDDRMMLGTVSPAPQGFIRPEGKDDFNDVPRLPRHPRPDLDRAACIGDERNDENLIVSQLHVAFLRAHNALVSAGADFDQARLLLRQHYQAIVLFDFLPRVADPTIVRATIDSGGQVFDGMATPYVMPLEFSAAAYRFGHSMVRSDYEYNRNFTSSTNGPATLEQLLTFTALSGQLGGSPESAADGFDTLPEQWIVEWEHFVDVGLPVNRARRIDTGLIFGLFRLPGLTGAVLGSGGVEPGATFQARLAIRNLLRGYRLRLPTGQAVARAVRERLDEVRDIPILTTDEILGVALTEAQRRALTWGDFTARTPLWYYILAEAAHYGQGKRLGPVGSTIVAEVLVGLVRRSRCSILRAPGWAPTLPSAEAGRFTLPDLLRLAGVLGSPAELSAGRRCAGQRGTPAPEMSAP